jgi:hypothetical protein
MKKIMLAVCLMFGGATLVSAQETQSQTRTQSQTERSAQQDQDQEGQPDQDQEGQQISVSELPDAVTAKLESEDYSGWTVGTVHKKMDDSQNEIYVVEMRQGTETKKVKFDRDGNKLEKGDKHKDKSESANYNDNAAGQDASSEEDAAEQDATEQDASDATEQEDATDQQEDATDQADNTQPDTEQQ